MTTEMATPSASPETPPPADASTADAAHGAAGLDSLAIRPRVRAGVSVGDGDLARLGTTIEIDPPDSWPVVSGLLTLADGRRDIAALAGAIGVDPGDLAALCRALEAHGFLWLTTPDEPVPVATFQAEFRAWCRHWVDRIYSDPAWEAIAHGTASPAILVGWAIENMYYTRTVVEHMSLAAANAGDTLEGRTLLRHLSEEWDHYVLFRDGCVALGLDRSALDDARPLASTRAITAFMRRVGCLDPLVFNACEALLEATAEDPDAVCAFFDAARDSQGYPDGFVEPIVSHVRVDEAFEHIDIFDELLTHRDSLPPDLVVDILESCSQLAELMTAWHDDVIRVYGADDRPFVRTRDGFRLHPGETRPVGIAAATPDCVEALP